MGLIEKAVDMYLPIGATKIEKILDLEMFEDCVLEFILPDLTKEQASVYNGLFYLRGEWFSIKSLKINCDNEIYLLDFYKRFYVLRVKYIMKKNELLYERKSFLGWDSAAVTNQKAPTSVKASLVLDSFPCNIQSGLALILYGNSLKKCPIIEDKIIVNSSKNLYLGNFYITPLNEFRGYQNGAILENHIILKMEDNSGNILFKRGGRVL